MFRIKEALQLAKIKGIELKRSDIANALYPKTKSNKAKLVSLNNIEHGRIKTIRPEWVAIICEKCSCSPNFLFGFEDVEINVRPISRMKETTSI